MDQNRTSGAALVTLCLLALSNVSIAQEPLFPEPFHVRRSIEDPITGTTSVVDEYYSGERVITVSGDHVSITDHGSSTLTEIDHAAGTWSRATFAEIAAATEELGPVASRELGPRAPGNEPRAEARAARGVADRTASVWLTEFDPDHPRGLRSVEVAVVDSVTLSDRAAEVVAGSAFPARPSDVTRAVRTALDRGVSAREARGAVAGEGRRGFPVERIVTWKIDGEVIRLVDRVESIDDLPIDPALLAIPKDSIETENRVIKMQRLLEELDRLPGVEGDRR